MHKITLAFLLILTILFVVSGSSQIINTNQVLAQSGCSMKFQGDANCDGRVTIADFEVWRREFLGEITTTDANFNSDGRVTISDFEIWRRSFTQGINPPSSTPMAPSPSPTHTIQISPTPTPPSVYRVFSTDSYWNTPFPDNAPIDPHNSEYIADSQNSSHTQNFLQFTAAPGTTQAFAFPIYWSSSSDKLYTISASSQTVQVRIPRNAQPASGSDGEISIFDRTNDQTVAMWQAIHNSSNDSWTASGLSRYMLSSNGLDKNASGSNDTRNFGHRGIPAPVRAVRVDEVRAGSIEHRFECYWWATGTRDASHYWPMTGDEGDKGGIVPEGIVIRIKPGINLNTRGLSVPALVIAKALQQYGCLIGDNSGSGNRLKLERNETAWQNMGLTYDALASIPWSDWEFIQGGYKP